MGHQLSAPKCLVVNGAKKVESFITNCENCGGKCISEGMRIALLGNKTVILSRTGRSFNVKKVK